MSEHDADDDLRARLRAADPASSLPTADPERVTDLLEAAMAETATETSESRETGTRGRSPLTWLVAAAAVVLIAAAGVFGLTHRSHHTAPAAQASVTALGYRPPAGRCLVPNVDVLRKQTVAFRGTLTSLAEGTARFDVTRWYAGGPTDSAEVTSPADDLGDLEHTADLRVGSDYLVSATHGTVTACGFTGPARGHLLDLYGQAFAG
jgi:hypothetical protein